MTLSIAIVQDTRRVKKVNKYPIKLRITINRKSEYYSTIYDLSQEDYNKFNAPRISDALQHIRKNLKQVETVANKTVNNLKIESVEDFEREFIRLHPLFKQCKIKTNPFIFQNNEFDLTPYKRQFKILEEDSSKVNCIAATYRNYIIQLIKENRIGTALNYQVGYLSLKMFRGNVPFSEIDKDYLMEYEHWMTNERKCSIATVGLRLCGLRVMFNDAIGNKLISREKYPFGKKKYRIPAKRGIKKALDINEVEQIFHYKPESEPAKRAKAYWLFCYFANGMNPKDFAYLKYKNIDDEYIHFVRAKTERTTKEDTIIITAYINGEMRKIMELWGNKDKHPDNYIFPVLNNGLTLLQQYNRVIALSKFIRDEMAGISKALDLSRKATNMVCRHTTATVLKRSGASTEFIQETLGHTDKRTTEVYLDGFEKEVKKEFSAKLLAFVQ